jgi:hypothetical protein
MTHNDQDIVTLYSGPLVTVELYQQVLKEADIESRVVGLSLTSSIGSALPDSTELLVKSEDVEKAKAAIEQFEAESAKE